MIDISAKNGGFKIVMVVSPVTFAKQAADEIRKVVWPNRTEIIRLTVSVVIIATIVGAFLGALDFIFTKALSIILNR